MLSGLLCIRSVGSPILTVGAPLAEDVIPCEVESEQSRKESDPHHEASIVSLAATEDATLVEILIRHWSLPLSSGSLRD